jgi:hypothetical protein
MPGIGSRIRNVFLHIKNPRSNMYGDFHYQQCEDYLTFSIGHTFCVTPFCKRA